MENKRINITAGECLKEILMDKYPNEIFVPFNEAMIEGSYHSKLFSEEFINERALTHKVTKEEYIDKLKGFLSILNNPNYYEEIVLWFGNEPFCNVNREVAIKALLEYGYKNKLTINIVDELTGEILLKTTK